MTFSDMGIWAVDAVRSFNTAFFKICLKHDIIRFTNATLQIVPDLVNVFW